MMKIAKQILYITTAMAVSLMATDKFIKSTNMYIRTKVVGLSGSGGFCTGIQVIAPSGTPYTLSAAHCKDLADAEGFIIAKDEYGREARIKLLDIDPEGDLMLLTAMSVGGVKVATEVHKHDSIRTITRGNEFPTYVTEGEALEHRRITLVDFAIIDEESFNACLAEPGRSVGFSFEGLFCLSSRVVMMTSAWVIPGSSGGPAVNSSGELVGIVSITDGGHLSGLSPLAKIHKFLKNR